MIRQITLSGFRGIVHPLTLDLTKNGKPTSLMVFGRNGTGKSSITDGWEWFHTSSIQHLAKEGAKASAYPSRLAGGTTASTGYVEVVFHDAAAGAVRLPLAPVKKAAPVNRDGHAWFKARAPHPCHIRFEDLNRFVNLTKTDRFDELANLMGFSVQVELLRQLRRVEGKLADKLAAAEAESRKQEGVVAAHFKLDGQQTVTAEAVIARYAGLFGRHQIAPVTTWEEVSESTATLTARVETDARAHELKDLAALVRCLERLPVSETLADAVAHYGAAATNFRAQERSAVDAVLMGVYQSGEAALRQQRAARREAAGDVCPLCGQAYAGDLLQHVQAELRALASLRSARDAAEAARRQAVGCLPAPSALANALDQGVADAGQAAVQFAVDELREACDAFDRAVAEVRVPLGVSAEQLTVEALQRVIERAAPLRAAQATVVQARDALLAAARTRIAALEGDTERKRLVDDHGKAVRGLELWANYARARRAAAALAHCRDEYGALVERYVAMNIADVEGRFAAISADVDKYFGILEAHTAGVAHPALRLVRDHDRAVVLEIEFRGEVVSPAYSYLSESQLNSFGLAVFLASARHINRDFRLLILDDVVNSFDAYKRPQMIRLLKQELADWQVVVLTHDDVWWTQLVDQCPTWARMRIRRYEPGIGPITEAARSEQEQVQAFLAEDEPTHAGRALGPMLERKLQAVCEAFQAPVPYTVRNEHTLRPLLQYFVARVRDKLGEAHPLYTAAKGLEENTTFRNFSAHWKAPASGLTSPEVREVLDQWLAIEQLVRCARPECGEVAGWDGSDKAFACACTAHVLRKAAPAAKPPRGEAALLS